MTTHAPQNVAAVHRRGVTLLEVLIAGGILVVGLAGVAAILPAAGVMLSEASTADRAAALANNAFAELSRQGTFKAADFGNGTFPLKSAVVGDMFVTPSLTPARTAYPFTLSGNLTANSTILRVPSLVRTAADQAAYGISWFGATATPLQSSRPLRAGAAARVSVVVTQSASPERDRVVLRTPPSTPALPGVYEIDPTVTNPPQNSIILQEDIRKRLLSGCTWVAVVDEAAGTVRWLRVANSWATFSAASPPVQNGTRITFSDPSMTTSPLTVYAFQGTLRVEERIMQLAE